MGNNPCEQLKQLQAERTELLAQLAEAREREARLEVAIKTTINDIKLGTVHSKHLVGCLQDALGDADVT